MARGSTTSSSTERGRKSTRDSKKSRKDEKRSRSKRTREPKRSRKDSKRSRSERAREPKRSRKDEKRSRSPKIHERDIKYLKDAVARMKYEKEGPSLETSKEDLLRAIEVAKNEITRLNEECAFHRARAEEAEKRAENAEWHRKQAYWGKGQGKSWKNPSTSWRNPKPYADESSWKKDDWKAAGWQLPAKKKDDRVETPGPKLVDLEEEDKEGKPDQEEDEIAAAHRAVLQDAVKESYAEPYRVKSVKELSAAEKGIGFQGFEAQTKHLTAEQLEKWTNEAAKVKGLPSALHKIVGKFLAVLDEKGRLDEKLVWHMVSGGHACAAVLELNSIPRYYNVLDDVYQEHLKLPDETHDAHVTSAHGTGYAAALNICVEGFIRPQASKEDTYCPYGFFSKGSVECYSKDTMLKAVTACSRKQKAAYMSVITEALVLSAAQIEGGISNVQAATRRMGAAKSTDGSLCVRSEFAEIKGVAFYWAH